MLYEVKKGGQIMSNGISYWRCSPELYQKYLSANKIIDTDFYLVEDRAKNIQELYMGKVCLSSGEENLQKINFLFENLQPAAFSGLIEDIDMNLDTVLIFDGGDSDSVLAVLDKTKIE